MRIYIVLLLLSVCFGFAPVVAQHTFDVKYPIYSVSSADYGGLLRITPTKILANGNDGYSKPILVTFDNDGTITRQVKLDFNIRTFPFYWYNADSNIIYILIPEDLRKEPGYPLHFIRLDTNLNIKSDIRLDSTVTGAEQEYNNAGIPKCLILNDSTILVSIGYLVGNGGTSSKYKRVACRFSKNGKLIGRHIFESYSNYDEPMYQTPQHEIVWMYRYRDSLNNDHKGLRTSDTAFVFSVKPVLSDIPLFNATAFDRKSFIPTSDSGIAIIRLGPASWPTITELIKFDSKYNKQWTTVVPGIDYNALQLIESHSGGYYIITQTYSDTTISPTYWDCFRDIAISRVDASGRYIFTAYYGSGTCTQVPFSVLQDNDGGIIISARYNMPGGFSCDFTCNETDSAWIFKVDTLGRTARKITGVEESVGLETLVLYPNPASGILTIEYGRTGFYTNVEIINTEGKTVQITPLHDVGQPHTTINISALSAGTYYCRLRATSGSITRPFIIQK